jgi:hypothetical protein
MSKMENTLRGPGLFEVINIISSNRETGRLEMTSVGTHGTFLFSEGKLVDAWLDSLTGFQAVTIALSIRDAQFTFDHSCSMPASSSITVNERIVLKQFFRIESLSVEEFCKDVDVGEVDWNMTPKQVVPLSDVQGVGEDNSQDTVTIEVAPVDHFLREGASTSAKPAEQSRSDNHQVEESIGLSRQQFVRDATPNVGETKPPVQSFAESGPDVNQQVMSVRRGRPKLKASKIDAGWGFTSFSRSRVGLSVALGLALVAGAIALKLKERRELSPITETIESASLRAPEPQKAQGQSESLRAPRRQRTETGTASPSVTEPKRKSAPVGNGYQSLDLTKQSRPTKLRDPHAQNLTGEWNLINTVQKTDYRAFSNLKIGFRLVISQTGKEFTGKGEKVSENGRNLPASDRTPIHVNGSIDGDKVVATFLEEGLMRQTKGRIIWTIQKAGAGLTGTFVSTAARSSGKSAATKGL